MKFKYGFSLPAAGLIAAGLLVVCGGCESTDSPVERVKEQVTGDYPSQVRTFNGDERTVYAAAKQALKGMDFRFTHGGPAQAVMEASSGIGPGDNVGTVHQFGLRAEFEQGLDGKTTQVTVSMTETQADDNGGKLGPGSQTPLRDTAHYQVFFDSIQVALSQPDTTEKALAAPVAK